MSKLFLFIVLLAAIYYVRRLVQGERGPANSTSVSPKKVVVETMAECAHCKVLVPSSEGMQAGQLFYCSEEHAKLGPGDV